MNQTTTSLSKDKKSERIWLNQWSDSILSKMEEYCSEENVDVEKIKQGTDGEKKNVYDLRVLQARALVEYERVKTLRFNVLRNINAIWAAHFDQHRIDWSGNKSTAEVAVTSDPPVILNGQRLEDLRTALEKLCDSTRHSKAALIDTHGSLAQTIDAVEKTHAQKLSTSN